MQQLPGIPAAGDFRSASRAAEGRCGLRRQFKQLQALAILTKAKITGDLGDFATGKMLNQDFGDGAAVFGVTRNRPSAARDADRGRPEIADDFRGSMRAGLTGAEIQHLLRLCGPGLRGFAGIFSARGLRDVEAASVVPRAALARIHRPEGGFRKQAERGRRERAARGPCRRTVVVLSTTTVTPLVSATP